MHEKQIEPLVIGLGGSGRGKALQHNLCSMDFEHISVSCDGQPMLNKSDSPGFRTGSEKPDVHDASEIPADRMALMQAKYRELKKKWPKMNDKRVVRKVAEYFKVKLV